MSSTKKKNLVIHTEHMYSVYEKINIEYIEKVIFGDFSTTESPVTEMALQ